MHQEVIQYSAAGANCEGTICYDNRVPGKKPTVLIAHAFEGKTDHYVQQAKKIAQQGYTGIAIDMYGEGKTASDLEGCLALYTPVSTNRVLCRQRLLDTYEWVQSLDFVDTKNIAMMGYCFGGLCALDLARTGSPIKAAISIHGSFEKPKLECQMTSSVLILHGYNDPQVPFNSFPGLAQELDSYGIDWQAHFYSETQHAFTDPQAEKIAPELGRKYNPTSCKRAWESSMNLLRTVFSN
jgi:dienelactone hydrolase